jgi:predicted GNAT superfamily acetyltransferase
VAWNQHLIAEPEGPSFISRTVERRQYSRRRARDTRPEAAIGGASRDVAERWKAAVRRRGTGGGNAQIGGHCQRLCGRLSRREGVNFEMNQVPIGPIELDPVLALNNRYATELSWLDRDRLGRIVTSAYYARAVADQSAFLIAFDQAASYDSPNFIWFRDRLARFVYIDRVAVDPASRGRGFARALYQDLFNLAGRDGHDTVCCEVNSDPPNPASDRLHEVLGFRKVGEALLSSGKTVRYFSRVLVLSSEVQE